MDLSLLIRRRLKELALDQKDLAAAAEVTESYISQLLTRKKAPPAPARTDIYEKLGGILKLPGGELARLADLQRQEEWKKKVLDPARPLFQQARELVLRKCVPERQAEIRRIFDKEPFGELERLVTQTLLDAAQAVMKAELQGEQWLDRMPHLQGRGHEQARVAVLEFLDTDVFEVSLESCVAFLEPLIAGWDMDLKTFAMEVTFDPQFTSAARKHFAFLEQLPVQSPVEPGFERFLQDAALSGDATAEELEFLRGLQFHGRQPTPLYYYRELQSLRDPLHFSGEPHRQRKPAALGHPRH